MEFLFFFSEILENDDTIKPNDIAPGCNKRSNYDAFCNAIENVCDTNRKDDGDDFSPEVAFGPFDDFVFGDHKGLMTMAYKNVFYLLYFCKFPSKLYQNHPFITDNTLILPPNQTISLCLF